MEIIANQKGSRRIEVREEHLETIKKYALFSNLVDSNGFIDEMTLVKLQNNVKALLEASEEVDKKLLNVCLDVIYHRDMKALGLRNLLLLYNSYFADQQLDLVGFSPEELLLETSEENT